MRWLVVLALAACAQPASSTPSPELAPATPADPVVAPPVVDGNAVVPLGTTPIAPAAAAGSVVTAFPADIAQLAISADGTIAVSADTRGALRLWPSLDGKHEPVIVAMHPPTMIVVEHDGDGVVIGGLDAIGQLELVRTTADGEPVSRVTVESARPFRSILAVAAGVLALRDDDEIALFDARGAIVGSLPANVQQRTLALVGHRDRVLALAEKDGVVNGRWLELDGRLHWGDATPELPIVSEHAALSPSHRRMAGVDKRGRLVLVDLETGSVIRRGAADMSPDVVGFVSESSLVIKDGLRIQLLNAELEAVGDMTATNAAVADTVVIGGGIRASMIVRRNGRTRWLGYRIVGGVQVVPHGDGFVMTDGQTIADIGHDLRARKVSEVAARYGAMTAANLVDDDHVVANFGDGYPMFPDVGIVDVSQNKVTLLGRGDVVGFERSTGIVVIVRGQTLEVRRYDRKKATFGDAVSTTIDNGASILMLDGKHGDVAVAISHEDELIVNVEVYRLREELEFVKTRTIRPPLEWWDSGGFVAFVPPSWLPSAARPSPDGAMVAEVRDGRIQLRDATGSERWLVPATGANDVVWTPAGELVAVGAGIARLDLTTGEFRERQCGWRFGLWSDEPLATNNPLLCEAP